MKKYFVHNGHQQAGPFAKEELKGKITPGTYLWYEGATDWMPAKDIDELKDLFNQTVPPPFNIVMTTPPPPPPPPLNKPLAIPARAEKKSFVKPLILVLIIAAVVGGFAYYNWWQENNSGGGSSSRRIESDLYLSAKYHIPEITGKVRLFGSVENISTEYYYNPMILVRYYGDGETDLGLEYVTISGTSSPGSSLNFDVKIPRHRGVKSVSATIVESNLQ